MLRYFSPCIRCWETDQTDRHPELPIQHTYAITTVTIARAYHNLANDARVYSRLQLTRCATHDVFRLTTTCSTRQYNMICHVSHMQIHPSDERTRAPPPPSLQVEVGSASIYCCCTATCMSMPIITYIPCSGRRRTWVHAYVIAAAARVAP